MRSLMTLIFKSNDIIKNICVNCNYTKLSTIHHIEEFPLFRSQFKIKNGVLLFFFLLFYFIFLIYIIGKLPKKTIHSQYKVNITKWLVTLENN